MGAAFGNVCYASSAEAQGAYFQSAAPAFLPSGNSLSYQKIDTTWMRVETPSSGTPTTITAALPLLPGCDPMQGFNDGISLAVAMTLAIVTASLFGIVSRAK